MVFRFTAFTIHSSEHSPFPTLWKAILLGNSPHLVNIHQWMCSLNLRPDRGGLVQPPPWGFSQIAKKLRHVALPGFGVPYGANLAQLLVKKMTRSGQVTELWRHMPEEQPPAILLTNPCFTAPRRDTIDANDNIWTWLGQDIARAEFPHCHSVPWGHLRSLTSDNLTFASNHIICDYNRFLRWWIRFEGFFCRLCVHGWYTNHMCVSGHGSVTS